MSRDPSSMSLTELMPLLGRRDLSARELVNDWLAQVSRVEPSVRAFVTLRPEAALAAADRADEARASGRPVGPLAGIPTAVKDLFLSGDVPTSAGSHVPVGGDPSIEAAVCERLRSAGAGLLGKTTTHEFGYGTASGPTRNPWDTSRSPGGSSGGSAAAVAAGMVPAAIGSDTWGSLRVPAAACGVSTLRPTHGRVSTHGLLPLNPSMDVAGPIARRMADVALLIQVLAGYDVRDPLSHPGQVPTYETTTPEDLPGVRIGLPTDLLWSDVHPQITKACHAGLQVLADRGAELVEIAPPASTAAVLGDDFVVETITGAEAKHAHRDLLRHRDRYTPQVRRRVLEGEGISAADYLQARQLASVWATQWRQLFADHDLLAIAHPTIPQPPPVVDPDEDPRGPRLRLTIPWSLTGFPALSVPTGLSDDGLPTGLSLAGLPEQEGALLSLGIAVDEDIGMWRTAPSDRPKAYRNAT